MDRNGLQRGSGFKNKHDNLSPLATCAKDSCEPIVLFGSERGESRSGIGGREGEVLEE